LKNDSATPYGNTWLAVSQPTDDYTGYATLYPVILVMANLLFN
jgi:hypothetical protein